MSRLVIPEGGSALRVFQQSVVPGGFWYFSLGGGFIMLAYAMYRRHPVFIIGQASAEATGPGH